MLLYLNDIISATRSLANNGCFTAVTIPKHAELTADTEPAKAEGGVLSTQEKILNIYPTFYGRYWTPVPYGQGPIRLVLQ